MTFLYAPSSETASFGDLSDAPAYGTAFAILQANTTPDALIFSTVTISATDMSMGSTNLIGTDGAWDIGAAGATRPGNIWVLTTVTCTNFFSSSASGLTFGNNANGACRRIVNPFGLSDGVALYQGSANDHTVQIGNTGVLDAADNVAIGSVWDIQTATPTNAATVRTHSFGITTASQTYEEQASFRANGDLYVNGGANAQSAQIQSLTELTTIAAAATTDTTINIPADAIVVGVSVRVTTVIPTSTSFDVGVAGATNRYGATLAVAADTTNPGTDDATRYYSAAAAIRLTMNGSNPADTTGRVRVTIHYIAITPPTS